MRCVGAFSERRVSLPVTGTTPSRSGLFWTKDQKKCPGEAASESILESGILSEHYFALQKVYLCHTNAASKARLPGACSSAYKVKLRYRWNIPRYSLVQPQHDTPQHFSMPLKLLNRPIGFWLLFESCLFPCSCGLCQFIFPRLKPTGTHPPSYCICWNAINTIAINANLNRLKWQICGTYKPVFLRVTEVLRFLFLYVKAPLNNYFVFVF